MLLFLLKNNGDRLQVEIGSDSIQVEIGSTRVRRNTLCLLTPYIVEMT
ncbi:hypothetical protein NTGBS_820006 [Candidatus Nitrotoga sp. BS]|nr:hypothetical protein NTGBS_820006 [Candidatus Nitrotoga sp. BS]